MSHEIEEFGHKRVGETVICTFEFAAQLGVGETISTQVVTASVLSGTDATPANIISGSATASGTKALQKITAGLNGVHYKLHCVITTSGGQTLFLDGGLAVVT